MFRSIGKIISAILDVNERRRQLDEEILWPACKEQARDIPHAKVAFGAHAFNNSAWLALPREEIYRRIEELK